MLGVSNREMQNNDRILAALHAVNCHYTGESGVAHSTQVQADALPWLLLLLIEWSKDGDPVDIEELAILFSLLENTDNNVHECHNVSDFDRGCRVLWAGRYGTFGVEE